MQLTLPSLNKLSREVMMNTITEQDIEDRKLMQVIASLRLSGLALDTEQCVNLQKMIDRPEIIDVYKRISKNGSNGRLLVVVDDVKHTTWLMGRLFKNTSPQQRLFVDGNSNTWQIISSANNKATIQYGQWSGIIFDCLNWQESLCMAMSRLKCTPLHKFQIMVLRDVLNNTFIDSIRVEGV